jgi:hypothetical protein
MEELGISNTLKKSLISYIKYRRLKRAVISTKSITDYLLSAINPSNINMFDVQKGIEIQYDNFCKILQDKNLIEAITNFLKIYYDYYELDPNIAPRITSKKLLFMWLLIGFPQFTISKTAQELTVQQKDIYPNEIYYIAVDLLKSLSSFNSSLAYCKSNNDLLRKFIKALNKYSNAITYFLERDKTEEITKLVQEYYDVNETLMRIRASDKYSDKMKEENEISLNKTKEKILAYINKFDKSIKKEELESYANMNLLKSLKVEETQFQVMLNDIKTKKLFYFRRALEWIKNSMIELKALKTKNGYNLNDVLDSDFIIQKIVVSGSFDNKEVTIYGDYLMSILGELQSIDSNSESVVKWNAMKVEYKEKQMYIYLANMIFFVMKEIHKIFEQIQLMLTMVNVGINPFS